MAFGVSHLLLRAIVLKSIVGTQMVTEAVLHMLLTEVERELNGCVPLIQMNHTFFSQLITLHNAEEDYFLTPTSVWKSRPVPSKKVEASAISGGSVFGRGGCKSIFHHCKLEKNGKQLYLN